MRGLAIVVAAMGIVTVVGAAELKIGYINSQEIFLKYRGTEDAQQKFDQEKVKLEQELERKKQELDELGATLERQSLLMSEETKKERMAELEQKEKEFQQYYFEYFGENGRIVKLNAELTRPIIEKMNAILNRIGADENFTVIFDVAAGGIVFAAESLDLTDRILDELNATVKDSSGPK
ncbi:OmpH family outer membrane protein [Candidatus Fermentibacteria bacterium]|nr:OmpH family outer membrane protein [Candidatus Fermentibacteria bacterium]